MTTSAINEKTLREGSLTRRYEPPAIVWEETLEIAGTLKGSMAPGQDQCGGQSLHAPPPPFGPGRPI